MMKYNNTTVAKRKVCVVVGASRGIGLAVAKSLYDSGHIVVVTGRTKASAVNGAKQISPTGKNVFPLALEVTSDRSAKTAISKIIKRCGRIDVLVVSAGVFKPFGAFGSVSLRDSVEAIETNLIGTMRCVYYAIQYMKKQKYGRIILFSGGGIGGDIALANATSYFTSKGAITVFAEVLAAELAQFNITVNAILPGQILTDLTRELFDISDKQLGPVLANAKESLAKTSGSSPDQAVELIKFLISDRGDNITGRLLSARWDRIEDLAQKLPDERYKLRRIDGKTYKRFK